MNADPPPIFPDCSVKIVSDGTAHNTKVYVRNEDGSVVYVPYVTGVTFSASVDSPYTTASIDLARVDVDVVGKICSAEHHD